jgi:hypothetical protein
MGPASGEGVDAALVPAAEVPTPTWSPRPPRGALCAPSRGSARWTSWSDRSSRRGRTSGSPSPGQRGTLARHSDLAAYRILQEPPANAAEHVPGPTVEAGPAWTDAGVRLRLANPCAPTRTRYPVLLVGPGDRVPRGRRPRDRVPSEGIGPWSVCGSPVLRRGGAPAEPAAASADLRRALRGNHRPNGSLNRVGRSPNGPGFVRVCGQVR